MPLTSNGGGALVGQREFANAARRLRTTFGDELRKVLPVYRRELLQQLINWLGERSLDFDRSAGVETRPHCPFCGRANEVDTKGRLLLP